MIRISWSAITALVVAALAIPTAAHAQSVSGTAHVVDGDSLVVGTQRVRLFGIDAPELDQTCQRDGQAWACGQAAKEQLEALVADHQVVCRGQGFDQYARMLAVCSVGYDELNRTMVEYGWAVAYRHFSDDYLAEEARAQASHEGIWSSTFTRPSEYRLSKLPAPQATSAAPRSRPRVYRDARGCLIKGNRNRKGQWIYHLPGMPYYEATRPEELFCTEEDAQRAGYRRAIVRP